MLRRRPLVFGRGSLVSRHALLAWLSYSVVATKFLERTYRACWGSATRGGLSIPPAQVASTYVMWYVIMHIHKLDRRAGWDLCLQDKRSFLEVWLTGRPALLLLTSASNRARQRNYALFLVNSHASYIWVSELACITCLLLFPRSPN